MPSRPRMAAAAEIPAFNAARMEQVLSRGQTVLMPWSDMELAPFVGADDQWEGQRELTDDPDIPDLLRAGLTSPHYAEASGTLLYRFLDAREDAVEQNNLPDQARALHDYARDIILRDNGNLLLRVIREQTRPALRGNFIDLLLLTYSSANRALPEDLQNEVHRLFPERLAQACTQHDASGSPLAATGVFDLYLGVASTIHANLDDEALQTRYAKRLWELFRHQPAGGNMDEFGRYLLLADNPLATSLFNAVGLNGKTVRHAWISGYGQSTLPDKTLDPASQTPNEHMTESAERALSVERQRPGGLRLLQRRFKLTNIGNIPEDWLIDLIDNSHRRYARTVLAGYAQYSDNPAIKQIMHHLNEARQTLPEDTVMLPLEVTRPEVLEERLGFLQRARRISGHVAEAAVVLMVGHGKSTVIKLSSSMFGGGRGSNTIELTPENLEGTIGDLVLALATPETTAVFIACSTGKGRGSIAGRAHRRLQLHTVAPTESAALQRIAITERQQSRALDARVAYRTRCDDGHNRWVYRASRARHFYTVKRAANTPEL